MEKVRINLGNYVELMRLPGVDRSRANAIIKWRAAHGPIADEDELRRVLDGWSIPEGLGDQIDFAPSDPTAPEAPGA